MKYEREVTKEIVEILMRRDNMTYQNAIAVVEQTQDEIDELLMRNNTLLSDLEDVVAANLGLEPDYLDAFLLSY